MKIAFDNMGLGLTNGNSSYTTGLIKALASEFPDDEYHVFSLMRRKRWTQSVVGELPAVKISSSLYHPLVLGKFFSPMVNNINTAIIRHTISRIKKADIYHCTNPIYFTYGIKRPVVTIHDLIALKEEDWSTQGSKKFYRHNIARIISEAEAVFTVSNHTRNDVLHHFPEAKEKIFVTYLGIGDRYRYLPDLDRSFLNAFGYPQDNPPFLLYVGETQPRKNVHGLITAFAELPSSLLKKYHLVVVGNSRRDDYREKLVALVNGKGVSDRVHFYNNVSNDDLVKFYNAAHAFVFPSFYEGFGIPVAEAMKCGCPVLTSTSSSLPEVGGEAVLYADPNDIDMLKEKLKQIIEDEDLRNKLREKGFVQVEKFTWKKSAELTHAVYLKMI